MSTPRTTRRSAHECPPAAQPILLALVVLSVGSAGCLGAAGPAADSLASADPQDAPTRSEPSEAATVDDAQPGEPMAVEPLLSTAQKLVQANGLALQGDDGHRDVTAATIEAGRWWALPMAGEAGRPFAIYRFEVTEDFLDRDERLFRMEVVPLRVSGPPEPMMALLLVEHEGQLAPLGIQTRLDQTRIVHDAPNAVPRPLPLDDDVMRFGLTRDVLAPGDVLHLVVGVETETPRSSGVAARFVDGAIAVHFFPRHTPASDMIAVLGGTKGTVLLPQAHAQGWTAGMYIETRFGPLGHNETYDSTWEVTDRSPIDPRPHVTVRDVTLRFAGSDTGGWSAIAGGYVSTSAMGSWEADADIHGHRVRHEGHFVNGGHTGDAALSGVPIVQLVGEGDDRLRFQYDLDVVDTGSSRALLLYAADLAVSPSRLLGVDTVEQGIHADETAALSRSDAAGPWTQGPSLLQSPRPA